MLIASRETMRRRNLLICLGGIILLGLGSRLVHTGIALLDKYPGDALYAVMVYVLLAVVRLGRTPLRRGVLAMTATTLLELFQLTGIPLAMATGTNPGLKLAGRLLGTTFSWLDLAAYGVGIAVVIGVEQCLASAGGGQRG